MKKISSEPLNRITTMNRITKTSFKPFKQVVGQSFEQQIDLIHFKRRSWEGINRKAELGFFDVMLYAGPLVVKTPDINRVPIQIGHHRLKGNRTELVFLVAFRFTNHDNYPWLIPGGSTVTPVEEVPGNGLFAYCKDPQGVKFGVMQFFPSEA